MKKLFLLAFQGMTLVAVTWCNYKAIKESIPFFRRQGSKASTWWHKSDIKDKAKNGVKSTKDKVVDIFSSKENKAL